MRHTSPILAVLATAAILRLATGGAKAVAEEPFMGAYVHLPAIAAPSVDEETGRRAIVENMKRFKASGLNTVIPFVTTTSGEAYYDSRLIPKKPYSWDPLAACVAETRRNGLKIYPTMCVLACGGDRPAGILREHPEWALRDSKGQPLGFISSGHPEARKWVVSVLQEIASKYRPDGILLDYCRYPSTSAALDPVSQARFDEAHPPARFPRASKAYREALLAYKRQCLTELVGQIRQGLREVNPNLRLVAYMWGAHELPGTRDWATWVKNGYLDQLNLTGYAFPKQYGDQYLAVLEKRIRDVTDVLKKIQRPVELTICVGINTSHGRISSAKDIRDYLQIAKRCGVQGAVFFTWTYLQPYLDEVKKSGYLQEFVSGLPPAGELR